MSFVDSVVDRHQITHADIDAAQAAWAASIEDIAYVSGKSFAREANRLLDDLYAFELGTVLLKPTLAREVPFRLSRSDALSSYIGGKHAEDSGFALKPWKSVRFGEQTRILSGGQALAMGHYHFTPSGDDEEITVEFTFGYVRAQNGRLKINLHHSSLPADG